VLRYKPHIRSPIKHEDFLKALKIDLPTLKYILDSKSKFYGFFRKPKKKGGLRTIRPSLEPLKSIQRQTKNILNNDIKWPSYLHGGISGRSVLTNAELHSGRHAVANLDIEECFPNTPSEIIKEALINVGFEDKLAVLISDICTYNNSLPQGAPTSTFMVNIALGLIDKKFYRFCKRKKFKYTRFVDDITVSANRDLKPFKTTFFEFIKSSNYPISKYSFVTRDKQQIVTGLIVNDKIRPAPSFIRKLKNDIRSGWPENDEIESVADNYGLTVKELRDNIWGRVTFVKSIDKKLGRDIRGLITKVVWPK
jgi:retron-type reverse transcriptase